MDEYSWADNKHRHDFINEMRFSEYHGQSVFRKILIVFECDKHLKHLLPSKVAEGLCFFRYCVLILILQQHLLHRSKIFIELTISKQRRRFLLVAGYLRKQFIIGEFSSGTFRFPKMPVHNDIFGRNPASLLEILHECGK